jgi:hypothetical protein
MIRNNHQLLFIVFTFFLVFQLHAQKTDTVAVKKSGLVVGIKYLSNNVYLGRVDSANIMYLSPSIGYYHKSGLHIGASLAYQLDAGVNKIDAVTLDAGYDFKITDNFSGGLSIEKYFYDLNSMSLNSVNDLGVNSNLSYDFSIFAVSAGAGLAFNDKTDVITELEINHSFELGKLVVEPALKLNAGTQNYYNAYLVAGKSHLNGNKGHGKGKPTTTTTAATYSVSEASMYKMLDYELSVPISYSLSNVKFNLIPTYSIPVNAASILSSTGALTKEVLSNRFVLQFEIAYKF